MNKSTLIARSEYVFLNIILSFLLITLSSCGDVEIETPAVGNINLHIIWQDTDGDISDEASPSDDCADVQIIEAIIYEEKGTTLYERSWQCQGTSRTFENVSIGKNRRLVIKAKNANSRLVYYGEAEIAVIETGMNTIDIVAERFEPSLRLPAAKETLSNNELRFEWARVSGASVYHVQVSDTPIFNESIIDEIITDNFYKPEILLKNGTYYCRMTALTIQDEEGVWPTAKEFTIFWEPWAQTYGPDNYFTRVSYVTETSDGGFIATGIIENVGDTEPDIYLIKTDSYGETDWEAYFGKPNSPESGMMVVETEDGNYIVMTNTSYAYFPTDACDIVLIEVDRNGRNPVEKTININHFANYGSSMGKTADGGYIIAGAARLYDGGEGDILLIKLDAALNITNTKTFPFNGNQGAMACRQTEDGGYIISAMTDTLGNGSIDVFIMKTNSELEEEWHEILGGEQWDGMDSDIQPTSDGGYIFVSSTESPRIENPDFPKPGVPALWVVKIDPLGEVEWDKIYGNTKSRGYSIHPDSAGDGYIVAGEIAASGLEDAWLIKLDSQGKVEWDKTYDGGNQEHIYSLHPMSQGGYILAGSRWWSDEDMNTYAKALLIATDEMGNPLQDRNAP